MAVQPNLDRLLSILMTTGLQQKDNALFQVISQLIKATKQLQDATIQEITTAVANAPNLSGEDYLTHSNESVDLPNSRQLLAGDRITFDDTIANQRTLDVPVGEVILTGANEAATLPNSRQLLAGANVTFDDATPNQRTINTTDTGEANTSSNVGTGAGLLAKPKVGVDLPFKSIKAGANVTVNNNADDVEIATGTIPDDIHNEDFLTHSDESVALPNSRRLMAGPGITFDDTIANQRTVTATREWSVLTDGDVINPEIIFAGGEVVMVSVP